ncbi:MAG TPA: APC family permease [Pseudonocardiaceae bacterium]|jgi:amino acid transporter|nr:APC family permease [Pseudonocardiaceae bacterium]
MVTGQTGPPGGPAAKPAPLHESAGYLAKRILLGKPLINEQLKSERLSNPIALGVLSSDAMSSTAYGTEEMLIELLPAAGLAAFSLLLPLTGIILGILVLVAASYRQVVMAYTKAGGSYVVARDNFGPRVAQVAAAALLIDYVVTVAVQCAAGTVAVASAFPALGPYSLEITIGVVLLMCYINLRGLREAGRPFAMPAYFFVSMVLLLIVVGVVRELTTGLTQIDALHLAGSVPVGKSNGFVEGATLFVLLRAFANGGSSLTGVEAISNTVGAFKKPEGRNARKVLTWMACLLGVMVAGVSYLAFVTHATPYAAGYPSVLSQEAQVVYGSGWFGKLMFGLVQAATALILYTGGNTSFNGFPFLASFVATDRFLPRQLTTRGHRLVFSNGIIALTVLSVLLLLVAGSNVNNLVPFYAIGVFTGFAMAGYGMTKHWLNHREVKGWRRRLVINLSAGIVSTIIVIIFAIAKFTEGAWLVVVVFPILVFTLIRLNREYRIESAILDRVLDAQVNTTVRPNHKVFVLVNSLDLAVIEALRYGRSLRPSELKAVHFMIDETHANRLRDRWERMNVPATLKVLDCPDRRLTRAAQELVLESMAEGDTETTVLLPRRTYAPLLGRLLHDRTADRIARVISRLPQAAATIVPYDVQARIREAFPDLPEERLTSAFERLMDRFAGEEPELKEHDEPPPSADAVPIGTLIPGRAATVSGRLHEISVGRRRGHAVLSGELVDETGTVLVEFSGEREDIHAGQQLRLHGRVRMTPQSDALVITDPSYEVIEDPSDDSDDSDDSTPGDSTPGDSPDSTNGSAADA